MSDSLGTTFDNNTREYWIVFTQGTHLISKLLKKDFSHVYVITRDKYNWIVLNPMRLYLHIELPAVLVSEDLPRKLRLPNDHIVKVTLYNRKPLKQFRYFGLINCVTHTLYLMGLRLYVYTPFQLYQRLIHLKSKEMPGYGIQSIRQIA